MVAECAFGQLKARFDCLIIGMAINLKDFPVVIHSCFILHNLCEIRQEAVNQNDVLVARNYDVEFQPETDTGYETTITRLVVKGSERSLLNILNK